MYHTQIINFLLLGIGVSFFSSPTSLAQTPVELKEKQALIREQMKVWSRQLGVTCKSCHDLNNFKSDKITAYKVSKIHMNLTQLLIDHGFDGQRGPKADCYMCHRGQLKPDYKEVPHPLSL